MKPTVMRAIDILKRHGRISLILVGMSMLEKKTPTIQYNERLAILKENKQGAYLMRDRKSMTIKPLWLYHNGLIQWVLLRWEHLKKYLRNRKS